MWRLRDYLFSPFGWFDLETACDIGDKNWLSEYDIFEIIDNTRESYGCENFEHIDPVASLLDHILQMARNRIEEVTRYDFVNDFSGSGSEIYTHSNFMCSSYAY